MIEDHLITGCQHMHAVNGKLLLLLALLIRQAIVNIDIMIAILFRQGLFSLAVFRIRS